VYHATGKHVRDLPIASGDVTPRREKERRPSWLRISHHSRRDPLMKIVLVLVAVIVATMGGPVVAIAQAPTATADAPFRFELAQARGPRGPGVEGYVYNGSQWSISNVRLRVESVDAAGTVTDTSMGWVIGNVRAGGRGYFYVPVPTPAPTYRATVQSYDKIAIEAPQAP